MQRKLTCTVTARTIFSPPHKAQMVSEGTKTPGVGLLANTIDGPERPTPLHLGPTKTSAKDRDNVRSASALSALKKAWLPTCPLNGSFQSPNCPLKGFFHLPNGIFSRKWPDGGRFFEPWLWRKSKEKEK